MKIKVDIKNRKASFDYFFIETFVAGIELNGAEVKSIRDGKISLVDSFCYINKGELFMKGVNISPYGSFPSDPLRVRRLLLKKKEIIKIERELGDEITIIIKRVFSNERGKIKAEVAIAKGKKNYDKRNSIKEREAEREIRKIIS